ncbi:hypothetical protein KA005_21345 [bacterium]|nr:hypothetical protein [bacterium]
MDATHREIILWALDNKVIRKELGDYLDLNDETLDKVLKTLKKDMFQAGYLFGTEGTSYDFHSFDTEAECSAYVKGVNDAEGWLECRDLEGDEIDFLEDCNPCCDDCNTRDPERFRAFEQWKLQRDSDNRAEGLVLDKCDRCLVSEDKED